MMIRTLGVLPSAMACKICGELCRCSEPKAEVSRRITLSDPDSYDPSEEQFASSLGTASEDPEYEDESELIASSTLAESLQRGQTPGPGSMNQIFTSDDDSNVSSSQQGDPASWKKEISTRLSRYKARRREQLGQSSLDFSFESTAANHVFLQPEGIVAEERANHSLIADLSEQHFLAPSQMGSAAPELEAHPRALDTTELFSQPTRIVEEEITHPLPPDVGKLIEFPRTAYLGPAVNPVELADPVLDSPRILDVPESIAAPPPPLSDIELDPETDEVEPHLLEPVLDVAPLPQRVFSGAVDCILVLGAFALFGTIAMKIAGPTLFAEQRTALVVMAIVPATLWAIYNYLFLVYNGRTPGMRLARLKLVTFDSAPVRRATRRVRVFALQLSCMSLALGLIWAFIDEDQICWHDRITHTYLRSR